jgi:hypothetical protein
MKILLFKVHLLKRDNTYASLFSSAFSEGIKDMFEEMGYRFNKSCKEKNENDQLRFDPSGIIPSGNREKFCEEGILQNVTQNKFRG